MIQLHPPCPCEYWLRRIYVPRGWDAVGVASAMCPTLSCSLRELHGRWLFPRRQADLRTASWAQSHFISLENMTCILICTNPTDLEGLCWVADSAFLRALRFIGVCLKNIFPCLLLFSPAHHIPLYLFSVCFLKIEMSVHFQGLLELLVKCHSLFICLIIRALENFFQRLPFLSLTPLPFKKTLLWNSSHICKGRKNSLIGTLYLSPGFNNY